MAYLVVCHYAALPVGHHGVLLLIASYDDLHAFLEVRLRYGLSPAADGPQRTLIYDVRQLRSGSAGGHAGYNVVIDIGIGLYLACVNLQYSFSAV